VSPQESVHFLKYYKAHVEKVQDHQARLKRVSNLFIFVGAFAFAFAIYSLMSFQPAKAPVTHKLKLAPKVGATESTETLMPAADGSVDFSQLANMASMTIWGLVLAKARSGLEAVETKDTSKVSSLFSRVVSLIVLICSAAVFKLIATATENMKPAATEVAEVEEVASARPLLKQSREYPESYYDETSPHYMGGAHNVALENLKDGKVPMLASKADYPKSYYDEKSSHYKGGAHNVALQQLKDDSKYAVEQTQSKNSYIKLLGEIYRAQRAHPITKAQRDQNFTKVMEFAAFVFCGGMCIAFFVSFKTYHASLQKLDKLTDLFNNPKARVANGEQGKRIMKKLQKKQVPKKMTAKKQDQNA